jgi:glycine dehydrogenase subunit 1
VSFIGHTAEEEARLLAAVGVSSFEELIAQIPEELRLKDLLAIDPAQSEPELRREFVRLAKRNYDPQQYVSFLGAGQYDHAIPAAVDQLVLRPEFYTAYTPYQAEVAQGTLAAIFEFQTMMAALSGLEVANASMYDGASAAAEALLLAHAATRGRRVLLPATVSPRIQGVCRSYLENLDLAMEVLPAPGGVLEPAELVEALSGGEPVAAVLVQQPNFFGQLEPLDRIGAAVAACDGKRPHLVVSADPLSLGVLKAPGDLGAETVVGDIQPLGVPPQCGGPSAGYFATRMAHIRRMPGRIAAEAHDAAGRRGFTLTLQTREQHIRRDKATSNICTNSALMALRATIYLAMLGPAGLREVAEQSLRRAAYAREKLLAIRDVKPVYEGPFFREFVVELPRDAEQVVSAVAERYPIMAGVPLSRYDPDRSRQLLVAVTEQRTRGDIESLATALSAVL